MTIDFLAIAREFGIPIAGLIIVMFTGARATWVWGRELVDAKADAKAAALAAQAELTAERVRSREELDRRTASINQQLHYTEARRLEERETRLALEARMGDVVALLKTVTDTLREIREDLNRAG